MIFRYRDYQRFLSHIRASFPLTTFRDWQGSNGILLRHDVDFDLVAAHRLAVLEVEQDVPATFFVRTASPSYNPMSLSNRTLLVEMATMGFEIGLHFDPSLYGDMKIEEATLLDRVRQEAAILESIVQYPVASISIHNPSVHNRYTLFPGYRNAYDPALFTPDSYISDSRMVFRHDIYQFVERAAVSPVQILLHPIHFSREGSAYPEIVRELVRHLISNVDSEFSVNSTYQEQMEGRLLPIFLLESWQSDDA